MSRSQHSSYLMLPRCSLNGVQGHLTPGPGVLTCGYGPCGVDPGGFPLIALQYFWSGVRRSATSARILGDCFP